MEILRIVVTGTVGAGKTSFIRSISELGGVGTDQLSTDEAFLLKQDTTGAPDFGCLSIGPNQAVYLYEIPGQPQPEFMWDVLTQKAHAYVFLVNARRTQDLFNGRRILSLLSRRSQVPMIIGLSHIDYPDAWAPDTAAWALGLLDETKRPPLVGLNATDRRSASNALVALTQKMMSIPFLK